MATRFIDHLLEGDHASRPAAGDVPEGTLYSCTDHSLVYQSDGATWSTWATLGAGSNPQFTTIELGHASDTTLSRVSAGVVAVEGTNIVKAGAATGSGLTMATSRLLGRTTASSGAIEEITVGSGLSLSAGSLTATGGTSIMRGRINADGTTAAGSGFSSAKTATGKYEITPTSAFSAVPVVQVSVVGDGADTAIFIQIRAVTASLITVWVIGLTGTSFADHPWHFMAMEAS